MSVSDDLLAPRDIPREHPVFVAPVPSTESVRRLTEPVG